MVPGACRAQSRGKAIFLACFLGLGVNFLIYHHFRPSFRHIIKSFDSPVKTMNLPGPDIQTDSLPQDQKSEMAIQTILHNLAQEVKERPAILPVLQGILPQVHNHKDITQFLALQEQKAKDHEAADVSGGKGGAPAGAGNNIGQEKCPESPPTLIGVSASNQTGIEPQALEKLHPQLQPGGHYRPADCQPLEKLAIIFPYRNRHAHLHILLNNLLPFLIRQKLDFRLFVIEQDPPTTFNRGMLFNVGFLEALKVDKFDCFIFHDVDMIPLNDNNLYRCSPTAPRHMTAGVSKWRYGLPYKNYFGGAVAFTKEQFEKINGDSNLYFGWGGEDDDLRSRVRRKGYDVLRYPVVIGKYDTISHKRDEGNSPNPDRMKLVGSAARRQDQEGLNTTNYTVASVENKHLYTWIHVGLNMTEILQTTPQEYINEIRSLLHQSKKFDKA